ncbi:hypothetical protein ACFPRL_10405 [Pseudoclavibacter helvolus]
MSARERRRGLEGRHSLRLLGPHSADEVLADNGHEERPAARGDDEDDRGPRSAPDGEHKQCRDRDDGHADLTCDVGVSGDDGVRDGGAQGDRVVKQRLVEAGDPVPVGHGLVDLGREHAEPDHDRQPDHEQQDQRAVGADLVADDLHALLDGTPRLRPGRPRGAVVDGGVLGELASDSLGGVMGVGHRTNSRRGG